MLPPTKDVSVTGTLDPDSIIAMSIDAGAFHHLMDILSNIYSDTALAVIREYITNALDSHVEAGQTRPVEVTSPSRFDPNFIVTDYGVGMSPADIENIYAKYGASTKRQTNTQAGSIGIGAKSGLAFTGMFTVRARKAGIECLVIVSLNERGDGVMEIQYVKDTDEPNGVQISIPVTKNLDEFRQKIATFHQFVEPGLLLVDGEPSPTPIEKVTHNMGVIAESSAPDYVVMGNVYYPIDTYHFVKILNGYSVVYYVPMGAVHFTPSREELNYDEHTLSTLRPLANDFKANLKIYFQRRIDQCKNIAEAFNLRYTLASSLPYGMRDQRFTYKGQPIPERGAPNGQLFHSHSWNDYSAYKNSDQYMYATYKDRLYVTNWNLKRFTKLHGAKIKKYLDDKGLPNFDRALLTDKLINPELFTEVTVIDWNDVAKINLGGGTRGKRSTGRKYEGMGGGEPYGTFLPTTDPKINLWYGSKEEFGRRRGGLYDRELAKYSDDDNQFVFVTDGLKKTFIKKYPHAKHWQARFESEARAACVFTDEERALYESSAGISNGSLLFWDQVLDPELKKYEIAYNKTDELRNLEKRIAAAYGAVQKCSWSVRSELEPLIPKKPYYEAEGDLSQYPLLAQGSYHGRLGSEVSQHLTDYVNFVYEKKGN